MGAAGRIVLGSRGSDLALAQAQLVENALRRAWPELEIALEIIRTSGDEGSAPVLDRKAGRKGMFTREIEKALLVRQIDLAVHSAKDLPSERLENLEIAATLPRANTDDVLVARETPLRAGAIVGTGSVRRQHQVHLWRADLKVVDLRGNVPTRLRKLKENKAWSGIILARAGLERLGLEVPVQVLPQEQFLPAGGQGIIALQIRRGDEATRRLVDAVNDNATFIALRAEREFLRLLNGDCDSPVGVQATLGDDKLHLRAQIFEEGAGAPRVGTTSGPAHDPEAVARNLMQLIYGEGK